MDLRPGVGMLESMNQPYGPAASPFEHPSLRLPVTDEQRNRAEGWLQEAYADGRISEDEFDRRIGMVISSGSRKELNEAFYGLVSVPSSSRALGVHPAYRPLVRPETRLQAGRGAASFAHFSSLVFPLLGPGVVFALSREGSYPRKEAAKAFNFQLVTLVAWIVALVLQGLLPFHLMDYVVGLITIGWFVLTVVAGAKALQGDDWRNPVGRVVPFKALTER